MTSGINEDGKVWAIGTVKDTTVIGRRSQEDEIKQKGLSIKKQDSLEMNHAMNKELEKLKLTKE
ncbi:hypothetical protein [Robertkochia solimangrovi]|uniref:hypothetical protein n=1 Tax=Robertkochia solimangrovi TaxID=2213046 RepID=UPI00117C6FDD|nr:hypothetical protein [Robertkochia solimangrovi]TRZ41651.1 hypothetical protein DMZ48_16720 [Robertkochia solimangrovi]